MWARRVRLLALVLLASMLFIAPFCSKKQDSATSPEFVNHHDSVQYVGMEACGSCHYDKMQTFLHTGMGQSFGEANPSKSAARFEPHSVLFDSASGYYYQPIWKGNNLYLKEFRLEAGDTTHLLMEQIDYIIGSGQHTNSHLIRKGDYLVQAPFTWYAQKGKLDLPPGFEGGNNSRFSRVIDQECMGCHNSTPQMLRGERSFKNVGKGIDCERCHGPGSAHVAMRSAGKSPENGLDRTIVNPAKLPLSLQIDVCQRCHLQGNNVLQEGKTFNSFRPGMKLADVFEVYLPQYEGGGSRFNMANHADRLQSSRCFTVTAARNEQAGLTCITCHNPHVSVKTIGASQFNAKCLSCHMAKDPCKESLQTRQKVQNNCVNCHMPASGTEDIPHVTVHDHKIGVHKDLLSKSEGKVVGLYCVNNANPDAEMLIKAYLSYYEKFDPQPIYQEKAGELLRKHPNAELQIHLLYQKQQWQDVVQIAEKEAGEPYSAMSCYRIGKAYHIRGNYSKACDWLQLAVFKDDDRFEYKSEWAASLIKKKDYAAARQVAHQAMEQFPDYVPSLNNAAFASLMLGNRAEARQLLTRAYQLDPVNVTTLENMVFLSDVLKDPVQMKIWLKKLLAVNPNHREAKMRLSTAQH